MFKANAVNAITVAGELITKRVKTNNARYFFRGCTLNCQVYLMNPKRNKVKDDIAEACDSERMKPD